MLDYTTCCKLKAAGYPQTSLLAYNQWGLVVATANHERDKWAEFMRACPNSDELIAAILRRWPMPDSYTLCGFSFASPSLPNAEGKYPLTKQWSASWWVQDVEHHHATGDTPAEALAALYLALAGGE